MFPDKNNQPPSSRRTDPNIWRHAQAGLVLAVTILLGIYAGYRVDKHWSTSPWGLLAGAFLGVGAGFYNFFKEFINGKNSDEGS